MNSSPPDTDVFRHVIGHFGSGVTIVTSRGDDGPVGFTASSVASLSLRPLLVMVGVAEHGESLEAIRRWGGFGLNILTREQEPLAHLFALGEREIRFRDVAVTTSPSGTPLLASSLAWLDCRVHEEFRAGDHVVVIGTVEDCDARAGEPLLYYRGRFGGWRP